MYEQMYLKNQLLQKKFTYIKYSSKDIFFLLHKYFRVPSVPCPPFLEMTVLVGLIDVM